MTGIHPGPTKAAPSPIPRWLDHRDGLAVAALALVVLAFYWKMAFTNLILPRGDTFTYFYPYWAYRNAVMQAGRLPLWNPYLFMGAPFLANSQAGVFYPPNWLLVGLDAPTAIKTATIAHAVWAAVGMFILARRGLQLSSMGALLAGAGFALGGYLTAQVEHVNQLQGLAWLPWLFVLWEQAARGRPWAVLWLGLVFAMQLLAGHSQTAFISGVGLGVWALWRTGWQGWQHRSAPRSHDARLKRLVWPVGVIALAVLLAVGLAAVQVLPTAELSRLSNRSGGLPFQEAVSFSLSPQIVGRALLPGYSGQPLFSEYIGYAGITTLVLALVGAWAQRRSRQGTGLAGLATLGLFLALGAFNPVYWGLVRFVPGFNLFRAPSRWLVLTAFATAALAGAGLDALASNPLHGTRRAISVLWTGVGVALLAGLSFLAPLPLSGDSLAAAPAPLELAIWAVTLVAALGLALWLAGASPAARRWAGPALIALAVVELFVASRELPFNDLSAPEAWTSQRPAISTLLAAEQGEVVPARFLSLSDIEFDPGDLREIQAVYGPHLSDEALYDFVVALKKQEILAPNLPMAWGIPAMDGFDGGVLPLSDYTRFTGLFLPPGTWNPDGRLREHLEVVPDRAWLRLTNTRWIITDKVADAWIDGVYYDLQFPASRSVPPDASSPPPIEAYPTNPFDATAVGIVGYTEGASGLPDGSPIGSVAVFAEGEEFPLVQPLLVGHGLADGTPISRVATLVSWPQAVRIERVEVSVVASYTGTLVVQGVSLIDERSGAFVPTTISTGHALRLAHSGDVKIYEYREALPRAYVVCQPEIAASNEVVFARLAAAPGQPIITAVGSDNTQTPPTCRPDDAGQATITTYEPERVAISVEARGEGNYLVLSDVWYPGWQAAVDGQPAEVLRANGLFRAVSLPEGTHHVEFVYRSRLLVVGAVISGLCLLGMVAGLVASRSGQMPGS